MVPRIIQHPHRWRPCSSEADAVRSGPTRDVGVDADGLTLLSVWAHSDDEACLAAGLMASVVAGGGRVVVVTATAGEAGTDDVTRWLPPPLARQRLRELRNSVAILGVDELHTLELPDGGCSAIEGTDLVAAHIRAVQPDVIVTFGPDGLTGLSDHRAVSRWTTAAHGLARPDDDLWYSTVTPEFHARWGLVNDEAHFFYPDQPDTSSTPAADLVHHCDLPDDLLDLKFAALAAHTTQTWRLIAGLGSSTYREWWRTESFRCASATSTSRHAWTPPSERAAA